MPRYKLTIEYDGAPYQGWQWQDHGPSVQGVLEAAAAKLNKGNPVEVYGSGRTDSGVHALAQIAHMDLPHEMRPDKLRDAINFHMVKDPVTILDAQIMPDEWHARFDAIERRYLYRIIDRRMKLSLDRGRVWRIPVRDTQCQAKSPVKTLDEITVLRAGAEIHCHFRARSFLHKQVRSLVGSLAEVGMDKWDFDDMQAALEAKSRPECGPVAPPDGLYLTRVIYMD